MPDDFYALYRGHRLMLRDRVRCETYRRALLSRVRRGDTVLDVGAGSGILSLFAAQAGAGRVYAVERARIAQVARELVARNGLGDRIEVIEQDIRDVRLPAQVDVIVSEWLGGYGVDENLLATVLGARDRWLKPGGVILPDRVESWLAPCVAEWLDDDAELWRGSPYGVDLRLMAELRPDEIYYSQHAIRGEHLVAAPERLWSNDLYTESAQRAGQSYEASLAFRAARAGRMNGLAAWFRADFGDGITLTNAPDAPDTHWGRTLFPLVDSTEVDAGEPIAATLRCNLGWPGISWAQWEVQIGSRARESHLDERRREFASSYPPQ